MLLRQMFLIFLLLGMNFSPASAEGLTKGEKKDMSKDANAINSQPSDASKKIPSLMSKWSVKGEGIPQAEAITRFRLKKRLQSYASEYFEPDEKAKIRVIEGDLHVDGNLVLDWEYGWNAEGFAATAYQARAKQRGVDWEYGWSTDGLIVTGNLTVSGAIINANPNGGPFLLVEGQTHAYAIVGGGAEMVFEGNTSVDDIVVGHYNDGILVFRANLTAPAVVTMDHELSIQGKLDGRWFDEYQWPLFLTVQQPKLTKAVIEHEGFSIDSLDALIPLLETGRSALRPDLPSKDKYPYGSLLPHESLSEIHELTIAWYRQAAAQGDADAKKALRKLKAK